jgi:lipopolysaccharide biosynthesis protein
VLQNVGVNRMSDIEDRLNKLQIANNTSAWARGQLRILRDMIDDRILDPEFGNKHPLSMDFVAKEINRIIQGMEVV